MKFRVLIALALIAMFALSACNSGSSSLSDPGNGNDDNGDGGGNDGSGESDDNGDASGAGLIIGSGEGDDFDTGSLALGMPTIATGGSTGVSGRLTDENGDPPQNEHEVHFSSNCLDEELASMESPVTTVNGAFSSTYTAEGCNDSDAITATVEVSDGEESSTLSASATVSIESGELGSVAFVGADPNSIGLRGMGGVGRTETSVVSFQVRDISGAGIAGRDVAFTLSTEVGDIQLLNETATSDSSGIVSTTVKSGTVAVPVRVNAHIIDTQVGTQSDRITISTGIPTDDGVSFSAEECWNVEALGVDGVEVQMTVRLRDRFSNPVVDGSQVQFSTEGGMIEAECLTEDSRCSVTWTSQNPRPNNGRSAVLAFLVGEESFTDVNGDGVFGQAEVDADTLRDSGEPFRDDTESGEFDPGQDGFFFDYDNSKDWTGPNGLFDGVLCGINESEAFRNEYCGSTHAPIGAQGMIIMSGSHAYIELSDATGNTLGSGDTFNISNSPLTARVFDINDNPMACGTDLTVNTDVGSIRYGNTVPIGGGGAIGGNSQNFFFTGDEPDELECGFLEISVTTPGGYTTNFEPIQVCDDT